MSHEMDDHDRGLAFDVKTLLDRRNALRLLAGAGLMAVVGCSTSTNQSAATTSSSGSSSGSAGSTSGSSAAAGSAGSAGSASSTALTADCAEDIPQETAGPYPGDGSNGPNVLTESGIVRSDITSSFGEANGVAKGVPLTIKLSVLDNSSGCAPMAGAAVYLWHCDIDGKYSMYSQGITSENYLRGVQAADGDGTVTFTSIFPAAYSGRWPHIHFEVYPSLAEATAAGTPIATSQIALPEDICEAVYATDGYSKSVRNLSQTSLETDNVFGDDGGARQLATVTGSIDTGLVATLSVPI